MDEQSARTHLSELFGEPVEMGAPLPQGEWSRAYAFRAGGRDLVVRYNPDRTTFALDAYAERFRSPAVPLPRVLRTGSAGDLFFAVTERAYGDFLEELEPELARAALPALTALLEALRTADTSASTGFGPWHPATGDGMYRRWADYLLGVESEAPGRPLEEWQAALRSAPAAARAYERGMAVLRDLAPRCPEERAVVHSDLLNRNVLVRGAELAAVLDWQCAMYGDHLYDVAWLTFCAPWHRGLAAAALESLALGPDAALRRRCYEVHIGVRNVIYHAWRHGPGEELDLVASRTLEVLG